MNKILECYIFSRIDYAMYLGAFVILSGNQMWVVSFVKPNGVSDEKKRMVFFHEQEARDFYNDQKALDA